MRLPRNTLAAAAGAALIFSAPVASADDTTLSTPTPPAGTPVTAASTTTEPAPVVEQGDALVAPPVVPAKTKARHPGDDGGTSTGAGRNKAASQEPVLPAPDTAGAVTVPGPLQTFAIPSIPSSTCAATGVPPVLIPIYQRASEAYGLGPQGPSVLAGINEVETAFGTNLNVSSAGAVGWMQFMPSTWASYGVDANGDGVRDPFNPEDAIFAAASYLSAAGMPQDTYRAIYAYNHADWYVAEVLANADCYAPLVGGSAVGGISLTPQMQVLSCRPAPGANLNVPADYLDAFESAAGRYGLGRRGVWAMAAIARLESDFGKGMTKRQLRSTGPLGLDPTEWRHYAVDGDDDGHIRHADPADSAASLARLIWSRGNLRAGVFSHNQAEWYVQEVLDEANRMQGHCHTHYVAWTIAPLAGSSVETPGPTSVLVGGIANPPQSAPAAVKAAINAANMISTTPYIWGGGHGSWYSSGYDCSGAVSFALFGGGLLDRPLTSGDLASWGEPGPGRWITIYASATHTYAEIAGLRWDTVGDAQGTGPRWHTSPPYPDGFVVRHPAGY